MSINTPPLSPRGSLSSRSSSLATLSPYEPLLLDGLSSVDKAKAVTAQVCQNPRITAEFQVRGLVRFDDQCVVFEARQRQSRAPVTIKVVFGANSNQELHILQQLQNNSHSVHLLDYWKDEHFCYIITDFVGSPWLKLVSQPPKNPHNQSSYTLCGWACAHRNYFQRTAGTTSIPTSLIQIVFKQCVESLLALHQAGYYHGNIKLDSFGVYASDAGPLVKIVELGTAGCITYGMERYGNVEGSPPELLHDSPFTKYQIDGRKADVFAMGIMLAGLVSEDGELPILSQPSLAGIFGYDDLIFLDGGNYPIGETVVEPSLLDLLRGMCCVDPSNRFSLERALHHQWLQF
ncbi:kinase-like protein [Rhizoclosmatium globosum]|uniref:Kinase-like protein n=1 Tax=Rhizoclosmatium globosum TaxID=329046 RepID=A0A1Y2CIR9_9FUNG|nr:kinase-like protein [Rhizoclosmatium globosum]|eukprot:ORY46943.1 kinase-like protein [Rhizoclosmatium globosum]